ncbi:MAG: type VII secretion protein EssC [Acutalibacteraceae bacterium]|nr:type VII secretion protein EssC [Acutalibacteraceae bacterium]
MDFQYKLIVSNQAFYKEFEIPADLERVKLGSTSNCEFRLDSDFFFEDIEISLEKKGNWSIFCSDNLYVNRGDVRKLLISELTHDDVVKICYENSREVAFEIRFLIDFGADGTDYSLKANLSQISELSIGDKSGVNIELSTEYGKDTLVSIVRTNNGMELIEKTSKYGTYVNGKKINKKAVLKDFDFISVADFSAYYKDNQLYFSKKNIRLNGIGQIVEQVDIGGEYPMFIRNTRAKSELEEEKIKILDPDTIPTKPELNIVTSLMPAIAMFALVVVLRGIMSESGGTYVIFSVCSMGMGLLTTVLNIVHTQRKYKKECKKRRDIYCEYIEKKREEIKAARNEELTVLRDKYYSTQESLEHIESFSPELFDRTPEDEDFLDIYLGVGKTAAVRKIEYKEQEKLDTGDDLCQIPLQVSKEYEYIENAPIYLKAKDANAIGIIGEKDKQNEFIKCLLIDIVSRQYFGDVNVYVFIDDIVEKYDWLRLVPHIQQNPQFRNIVCDAESKSIVFEYLYKELTYRSENKDVPGHNVIFILNDHGIKSHPLSRFIENASELDTTFIFFETGKKYLPLYCSQIVVLEDTCHAYTYASENKMNKTEFKYDCVSSERMCAVSNILAPVYCEEISLESSLRKNISLFELLGIYSANDLELKNRWKNSRIYETMAVPLGINVKNDIVCLNLHEKFHGPHGLVAGTTGSGKSEILQSFILSAATYFHPYEIGFVIIDFKGGGMVNQFKELPHLIGAITNIDGNEIQRSLKSIKAELMRRQNHFASAGVNHIDKYIQLFKDGKVSEALPHLIIIVDEFAELKAEQPEFMKELISAARIGRSLGVHLILATQKPSGVVDAQIWSNSKFKLCLKVQSKEDSNEVIKTPLAAEIKEPGRAYLQVGNNEIFELFQSAYSGAPATVDASEVEKEFIISQVGFTGSRKPIYVRKKTKRKINVQNQLEAIVSYIHDYCDKEGIKKLSDICLPPLPRKLRFEADKRVDAEDVYVSFGLVDDPDHQSQVINRLNITAMNYMLIGSTQTGKTNFLQTAIRSLTEHYSPEEVNIYIVDFASMILKNFENLNHVGGVVLSHEDEKIKNLFRLLSNEIAVRKSRLAEVGVSSFVSYKEAGFLDLPQIVVIIDNLTALKELYLQDNDMLLPICRDGNSVGITFLVSNGQTAGIGYRYLNNFEGRIALYCNESSEYAMLFEGNRMKLPNIPGRSLIQVEKATYECQMYLAFDGEKEYERVKNIQKYVTKCNERNSGMKARVIPEIPKSLDIDYIEKHFVHSNTNNELMAGLDYASIEPVCMDLNENNMIILTGKKESSRKAFASYILNVFLKKKFGDVELYVIDSVAQKWSEFEMLPETAFYTIDADSSSSIVTEIGQTVEERYSNYINRRSNVQETEPWIVVLIDNNDVITELSSNKSAMATLKDIWSKYSGMKTIFIFADINNANIPFNAPEIMKIIKDRKKYFVFDEIANVKITDVPLSLTRKYTKPLEFGDAYLVEDGDVKKIKTIN